MPRAVLDDLARSAATVFPGMPIFYQAFRGDGGGARTASVAALPFRRRAPAPGGSEKIPPEIQAVDPLLLWFLRVRRHLLRPGRTLARARFRGTADARCSFGIARAEPSGEPGASPKRRGRRTAISRIPMKKNSDRASLFRTICSVSRADGWRIVGRISDVINVAGKKVNPAEVEAELLRFAGVRAAVVFGRESALRNEEVAACVVAEERRAGARFARALPCALEWMAGSETDFFCRRNPGKRAGQGQPPRAGGSIWFLKLRPELAGNGYRHDTPTRGFHSELRVTKRTICEHYFFPPLAPFFSWRYSAAAPRRLRLRADALPRSAQRSRVRLLRGKLRAAAPRQANSPLRETSEHADGKKCFSFVRKQACLIRAWRAT